ncbi:LysR family transcriptional regulator [Paraburkholderia sp. D15]|uniref:LysR family transcriptional regulator n=1 Tax=Paraburkholderia sp. D15 TaxID=2880218 RepID=UPI0024793939|nr:LysR family transcriptional regulator [Paraburkholderia sp. D15]WGS53290.1 LysR family transcriptional regulator [Paraburkholderia sp. D15]
MNLRNLDLNLLPVFDALLRTRSTTRAAEELRLTQSAVSNALKRLRTAFDDPLFVKTSDGMLPTEFAQTLARPISDGLSTIRDAVETKSSFDPSTSDRTFHIYVSDIGQMVFIPRLMADLAVSAPNLKIVTVETTQKEAQQAMAISGIDLAIGLFMNFSSGFHERRLFREHYVAMVRREHPTIHSKLTLKRFLDAAHAVYTPTAGSHAVFENAVERLFEQQGKPRQVSVHLAHSMGLSALIAASDLLICVPSRLADALQASSALSTFALPFDTPSFDIAEIWHERYQHDAGHQWLRTRIFSLFHDAEAARPRS